MAAATRLNAAAAAAAAAVSLAFLSLRGIFFRLVIFKQSLKATFHQSTCRPHIDHSIQLNASLTLNMWSVTTNTQHYVCGNCQRVYTSQSEARSCSCTRKYA